MREKKVIDNAFLFSLRQTQFQPLRIIVKMKPRIIVASRYQKEKEWI
jgi:hypothetical protein